MSGAPSQPDTRAWQTFQRQLRDAGHRRLVVLEGDRTASLQWLQNCLPELLVAPGVWVGSGDGPTVEGLTPIPSTHARRWLGQELNCVIWDGWQGNPPDGLAALAGTLTAGGLMIWLMPPLAEWPAYDDPDYRRVGLNDTLAHPFAARLARVVAADRAVVRVNPQIAPLASLPEVPSVARRFDVGGTAEQSRLVDTIVKVGHGRRRRPLVITADRGRGKSAALGMAAARLVGEGRQRILVTAPDAAAVETLMRHAEPAATKGRVVFYAIDDLLAQRPEAELVIVDEAAAIPPYRLKQILLGWPRVVFATTVHGYEGAGRGFSVRFRAVLDQETPHWKHARLDAPIRWSDTDPLEPLISQLFLLHAEAPHSPALSPGPVSNLIIERWYPGTASEVALGESFGLLVDAHYRTTPADLRQWMDDPAAVSWRATLDGVLVGVLWATAEGGLDEALARDVMLGRRRIRGHLLPQSLASHSGFSEAASLRLLRVVRVAVSAGVRQRGIGQALIQAARTHAGEHELDALGTSFGGTLELSAFWQRAGLAPVRLGLSREASSGELPLQMLCGTTESGSRLTYRLRRRLAEHWLTLVPRLWSELEPRLLLQVSASLPPLAALSEDDLRDLHSFAFGHRGFDLALPVLGNLTLRPGVAQALLDNAEPLLPALWARAVVQGWDWQRLRQAGLCSGREEGELTLRTAVQHLLQNRADL